MKVGKNWLVFDLREHPLQKATVETQCQEIRYDQTFLSSLHQKGAFVPLLTDTLVLDEKKRCRLHLVMLLLAATLPFMSAYVALSLITTI